MATYGIAFSTFEALDNHVRLITTVMLAECNPYNFCPNILLAGSSDMKKQNSAYTKMVTFNPEMKERTRQVSR